MENRRHLALGKCISLLGVFLTLLASPSAFAAEPADYLFTNGKVYTVNTAQPWAEAVAVKDNEIVFVGSSKAAEAYIGEGTKVGDLGGRMLMPGIVESHFHVLLGGVATSGVFITDNSSVEAVLDQIREYATVNPDRKVIFGWGWAAALFGVEGPTKDLLDRAVPDRPAIIIRGDAHSGWANTKALEAAGVDKNTPDPAPGAGEFQRDADGNPTGYLNGGPAGLYMVAHVNGTVTPETLAPPTDDLLEAASEQGITTVFDAGNPMAEDAGLEYLMARDRKGTLPVRFFASHLINAAAMAARAADRTLALHERFKGKYLAVNSLKIVVDGVVENRKAAYYDDYLDVPSKGYLNMSLEETTRLALAMGEAGLDLFMHTLGDRAVTQGLDTAQAAREAGFHNMRITLSHVQGARDEDMPRFKELDVIVNSTGMWFVPHPPDIEVLGKERYEKQFRFKSLIDQGVLFANSSDFPAWPVIDPFAHLETSMTRAYVGSTAKRYPGILPPARERLDLKEAIAAYTINGAHIVRMEDKVGSIETGKRADLIVLDQNLFDINPKEIHKTQVLLTMMDGKVWHDVLYGWGDSNLVDESVTEIDIDFEGKRDPEDRK